MEHDRGELICELVPMEEVQAHLLRDDDASMHLNGLNGDQVSMGLD